MWALCYVMYVQCVLCIVLCTVLGVEESGEKGRGAGIRKEASVEGRQEKGRMGWGGGA